MITSNLHFTMCIHDSLARAAYSLPDSDESLEARTLFKVITAVAGILQTAINTITFPIASVKISIHCIQSRTFSPELLYVFAKVHLVYLCTLVAASIASCISLISPEFVYKNIEFQMHLRRAASYFFTEILPELSTLATEEDYNHLRLIAQRLQDLMTPESPDLWRQSLHNEIMRQNRNPTSPINSDCFDIASDHFKKTFENCCRYLEGMPLLALLIAPSYSSSGYVSEINKQFGKKLLSCMKAARNELLEQKIFTSEDIEAMFGEPYAAVIDLGLLRIFFSAEVESEKILIFNKGTENEFRIDDDIELYGQREKFLEIITLLQSKEIDEKSKKALSELLSRKKMESSEEDMIKQDFPHVKKAFDEIVGLRTAIIDKYLIVSTSTTIHWSEAFTG